MVPRKRKRIEKGPFQSEEGIEQGQFEEKVVSILNSSRRILVLVGAGISVSCGIPDFRSEKTGLYHTLDTDELGLSSAEDLFDFETFKENPSSFYKFARHLYPGSVCPSLTHEFLAKLEQKNKLLRVYTQNIDGLEVLAGVPEKKVIYAHGSLTFAKCLRCNTKYDSSVIAEEVSTGLVPRCKAPSRKAKQKEALLKKLSSNSSMNEVVSSKTLIPPSDSSTLSSGLTSPSQRSTRTTRFSPEKSLSKSPSAHYCNDLICDGLIKPGVTMFGEKLNCNVGKALESDRLKADAIIVMGTSLSVAPMSKVLRYLPPSIPRILVNRNEVILPKVCAGEINSDDEKDTREGYIFDHLLLGNCDDVVKELIERLHWNERNSTDSVRKSKRKYVKMSESSKFEVINERCYAFAGAVLGRTFSHELAPEVVHCDGCNNEITNGSVMKCVECFDFDLCQDCYHRECKIHFNGKHKFKAEAR